MDVLPIQARVPFSVMNDHHELAAVALQAALLLSRTCVLVGSEVCMHASKHPCYVLTSVQNLASASLLLLAHLCLSAL
jgi:hypothetical protein